MEEIQKLLTKKITVIPVSKPDYKMIVTPPDLEVTQSLQALLDSEDFDVRKRSKKKKGKARGQED